MAKQYYTSREAQQKLNVDEDGLRVLVRNGKLREFRDAGKLTYKVDEVDALLAKRSGGSSSGSSIGSGEFVLEPAEDDSGAPAPPPVGSSGIGLTGSFSGSSILSLEDTSELSAKPDESGGGTSILSPDDSSGAPAAGSSLSIGRLDDSGTGPGLAGASDVPAIGKSGSSGQLSDSGLPLSGSDVLSLEEMEKGAPTQSGDRKDDTVITNVGISVFDDDDLEIAADPMAKTVTSGNAEALGLEGSAAGSGLLDLTRESDDTSLGADVLSDIEAADDIAETVEASQTVEEVDESSFSSEDGGMPRPTPAPTGTVPRYVTTVGVLPEDPSVPIFSGLLVAGMLSLLIAGAVAAANAMGVWPGYLATIDENLLLFTVVTVAIGGLFALIGWFVGRKPTGGAKPKKAKKPKPAKKGKKGASETAEASAE